MSDKSHAEAHAASPGLAAIAPRSEAFTPPPAVMNEILVNRTPMLMVVLDHEWRVTRVNPAVEITFGYIRLQGGSPQRPQRVGPRHHG